MSEFRVVVKFEIVLSASACLSADRLVEGIEFTESGFGKFTLTDKTNNNIQTVPLPNSVARRH